MRAPAPRRHPADAAAVGATPAAPWTPARPGPRARAQWALAGLGLLLLAVLVSQAGPAALAERLRALGWWAPLVLLPYAIASAFDTAGWRVTFARLRPPFPLLYVVRLSGEALNNVTPTAYLGGEPVKAYLLHRFGVPLADGASSVILAKTTLTVAQIAFVIAGAGLLFARRDTGWPGVHALAAMILAGIAVSALLVRWQRRDPVTLAARAARRLFPRSRLAERVAGRAGEIDERLRAFYGARPRAALASVVLHLIGWFAGAAEVFVIMLLVGHPIAVADAVVVEALAQPVRLAGLAIPGALGVQEAGGMVIFGLLGREPELGLALMLVKRVRELAFSLVGIAILARLRPRRGR
jgi:putative membrane protein